MIHKKKSENIYRSARANIDNKSLIQVSTTPSLKYVMGVRRLEVIWKNNIK
jgi:hypothetical protein